MKRLLLILLLVSSLSFGQAYTTGTANWPQVWNNNDTGYFDFTNGVAQYCFNTNTDQGQLNGRYITTDGTATGTETFLHPGQKLTIKMGGQTTGNRSGIQNGGIIGFSLRTSSLYDGSSMGSRYTDNSAMRVEFQGGESVTKFWSATGSSTANMPNFNDFKNGATYEVEVISDKEFSLVTNGVRNNIKLFQNGGGNIRHIIIRNTGANMDAFFTNLAVSNIPVNLTSNTGESMTVTGVISNNNLIPNTVIKLGAGEVIMTGGNTYTGATSVSAGTLRLNRVGGGALSSLSDLTISSGAIVRVSSNQTVNNLVVSAGASLVIDNGVTLTVNGVLTYSGSITNNGTIAYGSSGSIVYSKQNAVAGNEWPNINYPSNVSVGMYSLTVNDNKSLSGNLTVAGALTVGAQISRISAGGTFTNSGTVVLNDAINFPVNFTNFDFAAGSTSFQQGTEAVPTLNGSTYGSLSVGGTRHAGGDIKAVNLTVSGTLYVDSGNDINVHKLAMNSPGQIILENNANLIQDDDVAGNVNTINGGVITSKRQSAMRRFDYVYWASPVAGQNLGSFSEWTVQPNSNYPGAIGNSRFYELNEAANLFVRIDDPKVVSMVAGKGYMIRAPNNFPADGSIQSWTGSFTGVPNNGPITVPVSYTASNRGYNLIGNPYPSTINADLFLNYSTDGGVTKPNAGTLYFWTHFSQGTAGGDNYGKYNLTGYTAAVGDAFTQQPGQTLHIASGQGFLLKKANGNSSVATYSNAMRGGVNDAHFFRSSNPVEKNRIWLTLSSGTSQKQSQALIGYVTGATQEVDEMYDGLLNYTGTSIATAIGTGTDAYAIQGRALPFTASDVVPLVFKAETEGTYTLSIDHLDGLFEGDQDIFIRDNQTGIDHTIKNSAYTFATGAGTFGERFAIVYQSTLGVTSPTFDSNAVVVYKKDGSLHINSGAVMMKSVKIFDMGGRLIYERDAINSSTVSLGNFRVKQQVLLLQVTADGNKTITKKVVY